MMLDVEIGKVMDFYAHPVVAGIDLTGPIKVGDQLRINGHTTHLILTIDSMQVDNQPVTEANAGDSVGIKVPDRVRPGDIVYLIQEDL
jgi:selenocysteine-specific translation elongation factor